MNAKQNPSFTKTGRFFASGVLAFTFLLGLQVQTLLAANQVPFQGSFSVVADSTLVPPFFLNSTVTGEGDALEMGKSGLLGIDIEVNLMTQEVKGVYTMTAAKGDQLVVYTEQSGIYLDAFTVQFKGSWTVISGTGRFAGATGGGGMTGWLRFTNHVVDPAVGEYEFTGTISSPSKGMLTISLSGSNIDVAWTDGRLQSAPAVTGPWTDVPSQSPHSEPATDNAKIFRTISD